MKAQKQYNLIPELEPSGEEKKTIVNVNKVRNEDSPIHDWYRFVLSFPPHLVTKYIDYFGLKKGNVVLDPFCGTGTTLVECKKNGINCIGIESNPMACFASRVKLDWSVNPRKLLGHASVIVKRVKNELKANGLDLDKFTPLFDTKAKHSIKLKELSGEASNLLLTNSISPLPLHKTLVLLETIDAMKDEDFIGHERLALAKSLVSEIGNLHFGPEVGVGKQKPDAPVADIWLKNIKGMADDLENVQDGRSEATTVVYSGDARDMDSLLEKSSIDAVITSPPYPNEKDYTRTTRLESVLLGFMKNKKDLQTVKRGLLRSNTRNVYKGDTDDNLVSGNIVIQNIADEIEKRRIQMGKNSGFEKLYGKVTKLYFGGMARHLANLRPYLRHGAKLAYVVGDQASYLRVMIRTGLLLSDIAKSLGYEVLRIDLFRTRLATATKEQLREEVVLLRWP